MPYHDSKTYTPPKPLVYCNLRVQGDSPPTGSPQTRRTRHYVQQEARTPRTITSHGAPDFRLVATKSTDFASMHVKNLKRKKKWGGGAFPYTCGF